ncbi:MAG: aspartate carbamoyltransferase [Acidimicrobiia bacterium]|nr:aspartate carbamoyltransferase [Acidimicrobiia bacterium]
MATRTVTEHLPFGEKRDPRFFGKDILSVTQFERDDLEVLFAVAHEMSEMVHRVGTFDLLKGKVLTNLFYEPSTRTSSSFVAAIERLGGSVIQINNVTFSSVSKGESLADTVRTMEQYTDAIVLRHPEQGSAAEAAAATVKPIINAGDGAGEHPTQALLDAHTIREEMGGIDGLTITMVGDLKYGRTVHSLAKLLTMFDVKINYVSPEILKMPELLVKEVDAAGIDQIETTDLESVLPETDVLYVTRIQKERFSDPSEYDQVQGSYIISPETMVGAKAKMALMHPLPRVGEITTDVDADPRAAYFRQMEYGMYTRMALLALVLGKA